MSDLRRKILDASIEMVAEQGVRQVSFREVARRAGVSHQAPYHHFGSYHGILRAIAREGFDALATAMADAASTKPDDAMAALVEAGIAYVRFARDHTGHFRVMFKKTLVDVHDEEEPLEEAARTHGTLVSLASTAVAEGYGHGMSPDVTAQLCWSMTHGLATLMVEGMLDGPGGRPPGLDDESIARALVEAFGSLMRPPPA